MILGFIKDVRTKLGFTQLKLAHLSNVSLATIQNIEAGKTNPTIDIMEKLFHALGIDLSISPRKIDLDLASLLGVPLLMEKPVKKEKLNESKINLLERESLKWVHHLDSFDQRTYESIIAFYMAIYDQFPKFWNKSLAFPILIKHIESERQNGRVIKLRRIAIANLCEYL